ncbi:MAG TPA: pantoate--beta-alanine ligase [Gammaproteobacteria bacterium]|nr:pantoate--beta-alanine ligase [Gammaproteobacteria bacterium]
MIERLSEPATASMWCRKMRTQGLQIGLVPTMGALHEGHLSLVRRALQENDRVCASIFVNPLQFNEHSDLLSYPLSPDQDVQLLDRIGCHMVFFGTLDAFFPQLKPEQIPMQEPGPYSLGLEGDSRPGHFAGVATIVKRLFEVTKPSRTYFGEKDFQQSLVVRDLARKMGYPEVVVCQTSREPGGLARSSRNRGLDDIQRRHARCLSVALRCTRSAWQAGERDAQILESLLWESLDNAGVEIVYATLRDPDQWTKQAPKGYLVRAQALVAARIGGIRLIDNMRLDSTAELDSGDSESSRQAIG